MQGHTGLLERLLETRGLPGARGLLEAMGLLITIEVQRVTELLRIYVGVLGAT
jgi:hypothetical protein